MKFIFYILSFLLITIPLFSQEDTIIKSKFRWHSLSFLSMDNMIGDPMLTNSIGYGNNKNVFSIGHLIARTSDYQTLKRNGVEFNYQFYPHTSERRLSLFLFSRILFFMEKYSYSYQYTNTSVYPKQYDNVNVKAKDLYLGAYIGYGLRLKLNKHFYLFQCNGVGATLLGDYENRQYELYSEKNYYRKRSVFNNNLEASVSVLLGLGIRF